MSVAGSQLMPWILMLELAEYVIKVEKEIVVLYGFSYELASASAGRNRLAKIENEVDNITKTAKSL